MDNKVYTFIDNLKKTIKKPEMRILPGQLAFFLLLSIIPLFALVAVISAKFSLSIKNILDIISSNLPQEVTDFIVNIVSVQNINMNIVIFCILASILASNGPHSMIVGSNILYNVKDKDYLTRRIKALLMTVILVILFLFVLAVPAFGDQIIKIITDYIKSNKIDNTIISIYNILKYPTSILTIFFFVKVLYTMAPDKKIESSTTTLGAMVTTFGWILSTELFSFYVNKFADYNVLYGSVGNLIVLFLWIYILSYIFMLGMALNATTYNIEKEEV